MHLIILLGCLPTRLVASPKPLVMLYTYAHYQGDDETARHYTEQAHLPQDLQDVTLQLRHGRYLMSAPMHAWLSP